MPPHSDSSSVRVQSISKPSSTSAGSVKATPAAIDSPAEPVVCTTVFSRMEAWAEGEVDGGRAEDQPEKGAESDGAERELGNVRVVGDVRLERRASGDRLGHADLPVTARFYPLGWRPHGRVL